MKNANTPRLNVAKPPVKWLVFSGLLLLAVSQRSAHAETPLSDDQMQHQSGGAAYSDGSCATSNNCGSSPCAPTTTAGVTCQSVVDNHWFACNGSFLPPLPNGAAPAGTTCRYPRVYHVPCAVRWTGTPEPITGQCQNVIAGISVIYRCNTAGPTLKWHNNC